jgi:hypothetical protein
MAGHHAFLLVMDEETPGTARSDPIAVIPTVLAESYWLHPARFAPTAA